MLPLLLVPLALFAQLGGQRNAPVQLQPTWKLCAALQPHSNTAQRGRSLGLATPAEPRIPGYALVGIDAARVVVRYAANTSPAEVSSTLVRLGLREVEVVETFRAAYAVMPLSASEGVASLPWVLAVNLQDPPAHLYNATGRILGRASILSSPPSLGGRGLSGRGIRVGIWDADVTHHVDFGQRISVQESELFDDHGTHVAGTVLGAGLLDPDARGMAPESKAWTYNFNRQKNGLTPQQEMAQAREDFGITLTQNSYGTYLAQICQDLQSLTYRESDYNLDFLACRYPTLTHIFAAGNDQQSCQMQIQALVGRKGYGTASNRSKNSLHVGAVDQWGQMTIFSNWGPQDDGRMFPTICAKGLEVYSTKSGNGYLQESGTSMACPTVTGHAALLSERYAQLHHGQEIPSALLRGLLANTATDAGRPGPDFQFGYGIMNAERAAVSLENGWYCLDSLKLGDRYKRTLSIPKGCTGVRVMLTWNDPAVVRPAAYGQRALVNDLNLSLIVGGVDYHPWVCDNSRWGLEKPATRKEDNLNNIEQITLSASELAGHSTVELTVLPKEIVGGHHQHFALTWFFEFASPRIISPTGGEFLVPGQQAYIAVEGLVAPYALELSCDGGSTWRALGRIEQDAVALPATIPADTPITTTALVRAIDTQGNIAQSDHPFTIAQQPKGLGIEQGNCGLDGWKLTWRENAAATNGYVVLLADPDAATPSAAAGVEHGDGFVQLGETASQHDTVFTLPASMIAGIERPIVSVACKLPGGMGYGKRAVGVLAGYSAPVVLTEGNLPFSETFAIYPSRFFRVEAGEKVQVRYVNQTFNDLPAGSTALSFTCLDGDTDFDESDYFNSGKNSSHLASLRMCSLDLTGIPAGERVLLHLSGALLPAEKGNPTTARMRVVADGKPLTSLEGMQEQLATGFDQEWYFPLEGGQNHSLAVEFAGRGAKDILVLTRVAVERPTTAKGVELHLISGPADGANLGKERFDLMLVNKSSEELRNLVVKAYRGEKWVGSLPVPSLKGMGSLPLSMLVDVGTAQARGELIPLWFTCMADPQNPRANAAVSHTVNSMGRVVPMGSSVVDNTPLGPVVTDPQRRVRVTNAITFTDNGGALQNYSDNQGSTIKFTPSVRGMKVRVRFTKLSLVAGSAALAVYTVQTPYSLNLEDVRFRARLSGNYSDLATSPLTYISEAEDGAVTLYFESLQGAETDEGWEATVDLVPAANPLSIVSVVATKQGDDFGAEVPIAVTLRNTYLSEQKRVAVRVFTEEGQLFSEEVDVKPGDSTFTLGQGVWVDLAEPKRIGVTIEGNDTNEADNVLFTYAIYDSYCIPPPGPAPKSKDAPRLAKLEAFRAVTPLNPVLTGAIRYSILPPYLKLYRGEAQNAVEVVARGNVPDEWGVVLWVDWDSDGKFSTAERLEADLIKDGKEYRATFTPDVSALTATTARARIVLGPKDGLAPPCSAAGDVQDFQIELKDGVYPKRGDLALAKVDIGESGLNLSQQQPVRITLSNLSNLPFSGKVQVRVTVDNASPITEWVDCATGEALAPYGGSRVYKLATTADLSAIGRHLVKVELLENPVVNASNNEAEAIVYCIVPESDGFYSLDIKSYQEENEWVDVSTAAKAFKLREHSEWSMEMVFRTEKPQFGTLLSSDGFSIRTTYHNTGGVPDNSIALVIGNQMLAWTPGGIITPGKWHHLAVTFTDVVYKYPVGSCTPHVYLDGVEYPLAGNGRQDAPSLGDSAREVMWLGRKIDARLALFRMATRVLDVSDIQSFRSVRKADGSLPDGYFAEYLFDEGVKNHMAFSGNTLGASIKATPPERLDLPSGGMWHRLGRLIAHFTFTGEVRQEQVAPGKYTITFAKGTPRNAIKGLFTPEWPGVKLSYNGKAVDADTQFDFNQPVEVIAEASILGHSNLSERLILNYAEDASSECELLALSLKKDGNDGLNQDITISPVTQDITIAIPLAIGTLNRPGAVRLSFKVSENAKLTLAGQELTSGSTEIPLTSPIALEVVAANGTVKRYAVRLALPQTLDWTLGKTDFTYGDAPVAVQATVNSQLPVSFTSTAPEVVSVAGGELQVGIPGEATVTAMQPGGAYYAAAAPVQKRITVARRAITVGVKDAPYPFGYTPKLQYDYQGLVNQHDIRSLPDTLATSCFSVQNASGQEVYLTSSLPVGVYTVKADASKAYSTELYSIMPVDGTFRIEQGDRWPLSITVTDGASPIEGATVIVGEEAKTTDSQGKIVWILPQGFTYTVEAQHEGYSPATQSVDLTSGAPLSITIPLRAATLTLRYTAEPGQGVIIGQTEQQIAPEADGQPVSAVGVGAYRFKQWSDGRTDNPRTDLNVKASLEVKALFVEQTYEVRYVVSDGGKLLKGNPVNSYSHGSSSAEVEVAPEDGYYFKGWSDGVVTPKRREVNITHDVEAYALFAPLVDLPDFNDFEAGELAGGWYTQSAGASHNPWTVSQEPQSLVGALPSHFATCNSDQLGEGGATESYLCSPCYRVAGLPFGLLVRTTFLAHLTDNDVFALQLRLDQEEWQDLQTFRHTKTAVDTLVAIPAERIKGRQSLQLRWCYRAGWAFAVEVDNIAIVPVQPNQLVISYNASPEGSCTFNELLPDGGVNSDIAKQVLEQGSVPANVEAVPTSGFRFYRWMDGVSSPLYHSPLPVVASETRTAYMLPTGRAVLAYQASPAEGGMFTLQGDRIAQQEVNVGANAEPITAVPASGYRFSHWLHNGDTNPKLTLPNVQGDTVLVACFERLQASRITFVVMGANSNRLLAGARLTVAGQTLVTNREGMASVLLPIGSHSYTVDLEGFQSINPMLTVGDADATEAITLQEATQSVTFIVKSDGQPIPGVAVRVEGCTDQTTDATGKAECQLHAGHYAYSLRKSGYRTTRGTIAVANTPLTVEVNLPKRKEPAPNALEEAELAAVLLHPNPFTEELTLTGVANAHRIAVLNALGTEVCSVQPDGRALLTLQLGYLPAGFYLVRITSANGQCTIPVVKR